MIPDEADFHVLSLANKKRKFAVPLGARVAQDIQDAIERGFDNQWFQLIDLSTMNEGGVGVIYRIFRLTDAGLDRLAELSKTRRRA